MGRRAGIALTLGAAIMLGACTTQRVPPTSDAQAPKLFEAFGNEPGWGVTVYSDSLVYVTNYGEDRYVFTHFDAPPPNVRPPSGIGQYQTRRPDPAFEMIVSAESCRDDMSGQAFERTVTINFNGRTYRGCGRSPIYFF